MVGVKNAWLAAQLLTAKPVPRGLAEGLDDGSGSGHDRMRPPGARRGLFSTRDNIPNKVRLRF